MPKTRKDTAASTHKNTCRRRDSYPRPHDYMAKHDTTELQIIDGSTSVKAHIHRSFHIETISKTKIFLPFNGVTTRTTQTLRPQLTKHMQSKGFVPITPWFTWHSLIPLSYGGFIKEPESKHAYIVRFTLNE